MAITTMKFVTIAGQLNDFDTIAERYIYGRDIHLENTMSVLTNRGKLTPFDDNNEYDSVAKDALNALKMAGKKPEKSAMAPDTMAVEDMRALIKDVNARITDEQAERERLTKEIEQNKKNMDLLNMMGDIKADIGKLRDMEFIQCRFGHLPKVGFKVLITYLGRIEAFFIKTAETDTDVWGFCFSPRVKQRKTEEIFNSLYFEEEEIPQSVNGTVGAAKEDLKRHEESLKVRLSANSEQAAKALEGMKTNLAGVCNLAEKRSRFAKIRSMAAHSDAFFYVVGWMAKKDAQKLERDIAKTGDIVMFYAEEAENVKSCSPPTKLKNNPIFKPFEMFVRMYGLPSYHEIDPTPILAITYILFFGIMFGDVGQSAVFAILGFILYKIKKMDLAGIVGWVGLSGIVFGFIYGSFFGNEEIIPRLFGTTPIRPMEQAIMMLGATIAMGVVIIIFGLILHIINSVKERNIGEAIFGHNGLAGLVFYVTMLVFAGNAFLKWNIPGALFGVLIGISLLCMFLSKPLSDLIAGKKGWLPKEGIFYVENLFEMFEVVLSFFTNTISFLRIGAFAIVHVGMMMVVSILTPAGIGVGSVLVMIIGNAVVMVLEGLIVGIQVLRLEYYEMFSRYFTGRGKEFVTLSDK